MFTLNIEIQYFFPISQMGQGGSIKRDIKSWKGIVKKMIENLKQANIQLNESK